MKKPQLIPIEEKDLPRIRAHMREHAIQATGAPSPGMEIAGMIRILANLYDLHRLECSQGHEISAPRMGILLRLMAEEKQGNTQGMTPSQFSHNQNVSRNTISALLRGLETQGLIARRLDAHDRRVFRISLTETGRSLASQIGPKMVQGASLLASGLTPQEQEHLLDLLSRLFLSLKKNLENQGITPPEKE